MGKVPMPVVIGLLVIAVLVIFFSLRNTMGGPPKEQTSTKVTTSDPRVAEEMRKRGMGGRMNTGGMTPQMQGGGPPGNSGNPTGGPGAPGR